MVMSVGICECGCGEFDHEVGGLWEELDQHEYENWQRHQCTKQCPAPCLVARCRDSFDGDGFWVWCSNCDIQCSGSWEAYSDEPQEEDSGDIDEDEDEDEDEESPEEYSEVASQQFASRWAPVDIGTQIRVDFSDGDFVITDAVVLNEFEDLARLSTFRERPNEPQVRAFFAAGVDGVEILVNLSEITDVLA